MPSKQGFVALVTLLTFCALAGASHAAPPSVMRQQANTVRQAIKKNVDTIIRPRLVVAKGATGPVSTMALSRDERFLITATGDNSLRLWDLSAGREVAKLTGHATPAAAVAISPDSGSAASIDRGGEIRLWDLATLGESKILARHPGGVRGVGFPRDGRTLFVGDETGRVTTYPLSGAGQGGGFQICASNIGAMSVSPDGSAVIAACADGRIVRHDPASGIKMADYAGSGRSILVMTASQGRNLAAGGDEKGRVFVWSLDTGAVVTDFKAGEAAVTSLAISETSGNLVVGDKNGLVTLWSAAGVKLKELGRHEGAVNFAQFDNAGTYLLTASADGATRLWSVPGGALLVSLFSTESGWAVVDPKGRFDGTQEALAGIEWQADQHRLPMPNFSETYYEPTLLAQAKGGTPETREVQGIPDGIHLPPRIEIALREGESAPAEATPVDVRALDQGGGGVEDVRLYANGKLIGDDKTVDVRREEKDGAPEVVKRYQVSLAPGDNLLSAVAVNRERLESPPVEVRVGGGQAAPSTLWLLTVGINSYKNSHQNLEYAEPDAASIRDFFRPPRKLPFTVGKTAHLADHQATKQGILESLRRFRQLPPQDVVIVYMAGHGFALDNEWYFVPHELMFDPTAPFPKEVGLSSAELKSELDAVSANRVFLVIDACHSGGAVDPIKNFQGMKALRMLARNAGVHILAATDRDQLAVEHEALGHGVFTYALLKVLAGGGDQPPVDGLVTVRETMRYVEKTVPALSQRYAQYLQYPTAHSRGYDFGLAFAR